MLTTTECYGQRPRKRTTEPWIAHAYTEPLSWRRRIGVTSAERSGRDGAVSKCDGLSLALGGPDPNSMILHLPGLAARDCQVRPPLYAEGGSTVISTR